MHYVRNVWILYSTIFKKNKKMNNNQILVGEQDEYIAVCRKHYLE